MIAEFVLVIIIPILILLFFGIYWGKQYNKIVDERNAEYLKILNDKHIHPLMSSAELNSILENNSEEEKRNVEMMFRLHFNFLRSIVLYHILGIIYLVFTICKIYCVFQSGKYNFSNGLEVRYILVLLISILMWHEFFGKSLFDFLKLRRISKFGDTIWEFLKKIGEEMKERVFGIFKFIVVFILNFLFFMGYLCLWNKHVLPEFFEMVNRDKSLLVLYLLLIMASYQFVVIRVIAWILNHPILCVIKKLKCKNMEKVNKYYYKEKLESVIYRASYLVFIIMYIYIKIYRPGSFEIPIEAIGILFMLETVFGGKIGGGKEGC